MVAWNRHDRGNGLSTSNDIASLFAKFGGRPENYQEIGREDKAKQSQQRWPLLASVGQAKAIHPPSVNSSAFRRGHNVHRQPAAPTSVAAAPAAAPVAAAWGVRVQPEGAVRFIGAAGTPAGHNAAEVRKSGQEPTGTPLHQMFERLRQGGEPEAAVAQQTSSSTRVDTLFRRLGGR